MFNYIFQNVWYYIIKALQMVRVKMSVHNNLLKLN